MKKLLILALLLIPLSATAITVPWNKNVAGKIFPPIVTDFVGIGTTTPYAPLSVVGQVVASFFTATSTTASSTFIGVDATRVCLTGTTICLKDPTGTVNSGIAGQLGWYATSGTTISGTSTNPLTVGSILATSTATSTFVGGVQALQFGATATSSLAGLNISTGGLTIGALNGFLKATAGAVTTALINLTSDVTGNLPVTNLNSGTSAGNTTFWRGDGVWATPAGGGNVSGTGINNTFAMWTGLSTITASSAPTADYYVATSTTASSTFIGLTATRIGGTTATSSLAGLSILTGGLTIGTLPSALLKTNITGGVVSAVANTDYVATSRAINTTAPLAGGGDLSADRNLTCTTCVTNVTGSGNIASSGGTTPNITFTGTLPIANGGTNATTYITNTPIVFDGTRLVGTTTGPFYMDNFIATSTATSTNRGNLMVGPLFGATATNSPIASIHMGNNIAGSSVVPNAEIILGNVNAGTTDNIMGQISFYSNDASSIAKGRQAAIKAITQDSAGRTSRLAFFTGAGNTEGNQEGMTIDSSGLVGIGTAAPGNLLTVALGAGAIAQLNNSSSDSAIWGTNIGLISEGSIAKLSAVGTDDFTFYTGGTINSMTEGTEQLRLTTNGRIGSATSTPWGQLSVNPTGSLASGPSFVVGSSTATSFIINNNGRVGIATTSPWRTFSVDGTVGMNNLTTAAAALTGGSYLCLSSTKEVVADTASCLISSARFKHAVLPLNTGLIELMALKPVSFRYNLTGDRDLDTQGTQIGFIAEDVAQVEPRLVEMDTEGRPFKVRYENMISLVVKSTQDLANMVSGHDQRIEQLEFENRLLKMRLDRLENKSNQ